MKFTEEKLEKAFTELLGQERGKVKVQSFVGSSVVKIRASSDLSASGGPVRLWRTDCRKQQLKNQQYDKHSL